VAAAFVLAPFVADFLSKPEMESQIRGLLLGAAVLALTAPREAFKDIQGSVRKLLRGDKPS
jgi:hypothetical protein